jgi:hypothetical protein
MVVVRTEVVATLATQMSCKAAHMLLVKSFILPACGDAPGAVPAVHLYPLELRSHCSSNLCTCQPEVCRLQDQQLPEAAMRRRRANPISVKLDHVFPVVCSSRLALDIEMSCTA